MRASAVAAATAALLTAAFLVLHTGARGDRLCEREVFVRGGELSLWPPGTRCTYGEPAQTGVELHPIFVTVLLVVAVAAVVLVPRMRRPRRAEAA